MCSPNFLLVELHGGRGLAELKGKLGISPAGDSELLGNRRLWTQKDYSCLLGF